eukprot:jgi/Hompol1/1559/HPOL_003421-RA
MSMDITDSITALLQQKRRATEMSAKYETITRELTSSSSALGLIESGALMRSIQSGKVAVTTAIYWLLFLICKSVDEQMPQTAHDALKRALETRECVDTDAIKSLDILALLELLGFTTSVTGRHPVASHLTLVESDHDSKYVKPPPSRLLQSMNLKYFLKAWQILASKM